MQTVYEVLFMLHVLGIAMGFSVSFANIVMASVAEKATPGDRAVLARFPPAMTRVGDLGLVLLWVTGLILLFGKWGGFASLPWQFDVKIAAVVALSGIVGYIHTQMRKARGGDQAAAARIPIAGRFALLMALTALVFAVLTFR